MKIPFLSKLTGADARPYASTLSYAASLSASQKTRYKALLTGILAELPDLLAVSVIDLRAGRQLAGYEPPGKLSPAKAAPYYAEIVRQKQQALQALGLSGEAIEDVLITLQSQWQVLRLLPGQQQVLHLLVSKRDTNLALARAVLQTQAAAAADQKQALPESGS